MEKIDKGVLYDAVICKEEDSVLEASRVMRDTRTRHLIVVDDSLKPLGIISPFDISNRVVAEEKNPSEVFAKDIMTAPVETIDVSSNFEEAAQKMASLETFTMPVTENGGLVGILDYSLVFKKLCEVKKDD